MTDWVGGIDEMPGGAVAVDLNAKGGVDVDADLPDVCRNHYLLLASPNIGVQRLLYVDGMGVEGVFRPELAP